MKPHIATHLVRELIADQFPQWFGLSIRPVLESGWDNRTFRFGDHLLVRMPSAESYASQVDVEQRWLPTLAPLLPASIPTPVALGEPVRAYPWRWSVYKWLPGEPAAVAAIADMDAFACDLAEFLVALQIIPTSGGPPAGARNFYRGGPLAAYDDQARRAISALPEPFDRTLVASLWADAMDTEWNKPPVWVHGDFASRNLLIDQGQLSSVIDFGQLGVGDPACDLAIAWTFLRGARRETFRARLPLDAATWLRARAWVVWKASILMSGIEQGPTVDIETAVNTLTEVMAGYQRAA